MSEIFKNRKILQEIENLIILFMILPIKKALKDKVLNVKVVLK